jgi:hypothetical protein
MLTFLLNISDAFQKLETLAAVGKQFLVVIG